ncbi:hypothetical protein [Desulfovibrio sp. JC010]|uniref:hypothetical protein n=1 Tax=Desulfovibrio sp. JC010 TaxID=2593641 RepID=UPI0013D3E4A2|nr:hypothetical protein [Desulfovibrio sp. JC010]NDV28582.1 hypothetical protein [Desulfovibrio sp. JC010]
MKPYIMNYSQTIKLAPSNQANSNYETTVTKTIEGTDPDLYLSDSTVETRTIEPGDPDLMFAEGTMQTFTVEPVDPDMFLLSQYTEMQGQDTTWITESLEPSDEDYYTN